MKKIETIILERSDLKDPKKPFCAMNSTIFFKNLNPDDPAAGIKELNTCQMIIFIDDDGQTVVLKNRYGNNGGVIAPAVKSMNLFLIDTPQNVIKIAVPTDYVTVNHLEYLSKLYGNVNAFYSASGAGGDDVIVLNFI